MVTGISLFSDWKHGLAKPRDSRVPVLRVLPALAVILQFCQCGQKSSHGTPDSWKSRK